MVLITVILLKTGENYTIRSFMIFTLTKYYLGDQIKEDEMGGACGMYGVGANSYINLLEPEFYI